MEKPSLTPIRISALSMLEFADLIKRTQKLIEESKTKTKISSLNLHLTYLNNKLPLYQDAIKQIRTSPDTQDLAQLDQYRDQDAQALFSSLKAFKNSRKPVEIEAYKLLKRIFDNYKHLYQSTYSGESILIEKFLKELNGSDAQTALQELGLTRFVTNLTESQKAFEKAFDKREANDSQASPIKTSQLRKEMTYRYKLLCQATLNLAYLDQIGELSSPEVPVLLKHLNKARKEMAEQTKRSTSKSKKTKNTENSQSHD